VHFPPTSLELINEFYARDAETRVKPPFRLPTTTQCARISLIDDNVLEDARSKILLLNMFVNDSAIQLEDPESVVVTILDDDCELDYIAIYHLHI